MATSVTHPHSAFGVEEARVALADILEAFDAPQNSAKMTEAKESAGNDMLKMMQFVFPLATQIQMEVITKYGFVGDGDGIVRFSQMIKLLEKQDQQVAQLNSELRSVIMPQMAAPDPQASAS